MMAAESGTAEGQGGLGVCVRCHVFLGKGCYRAQGEDEDGDKANYHCFRKLVVHFYSLLRFFAAKQYARRVI